MYALREAIKGMLRIRYMTVISIVTILVTLTLLGILGVVTVFTNGLVNKIRGSEEINVYLADEMPDEDMLALDASIIFFCILDMLLVTSRLTFTGVMP